ncbi:MAG: GPI anchored serine-threonine rich family protein [Cyclobacteriaceae bacterium]|nr:GPI anchored serine-threonine rich family protein [Cyclobacteriaceae bacterium]
MQKLLLTSLVVCASCNLLAAQEFTINRLELSEGKVVIHYDLRDTVAGRSYTINTYASLDNFVTPLQKITGDVGTEVKPGLGRKITWDAPAELGPSFVGKVSLEIRGRVFVPFIKLDRFEDYKTFKRGKPYTIAWNGGRSSTIMNWDLYRGEEKVATFPNVANSGNYDLVVPTTVKPGTYRLKIADSKNKDEVIYTNNFKVKRKFPLLAKVIPIIGLGILVSTLAGGGGGEVAPEDGPLPTPQFPPN